MEFARRNLGQPPFGLITPTKQIDFGKVFTGADELSFHGAICLTEIVWDEKIRSGGNWGRTRDTHSLWDHSMDGLPARVAIYRSPFG